MTGSRFPGLPPGTEPGTLDTLRQPHPTQLTDGAAPDTDPDRLTEPASPDAGIKATPLRGRPFGPRLDPDTATTRPTPGGHGKKKGQPARPHGLTGPTPSGMTWVFLVGVAGFEPTASSSRTKRSSSGDGEVREVGGCAIRRAGTRETLHSSSGLALPRAHFAEAHDLRAGGQVRFVQVRFVTVWSANILPTN